MFILAVFSDHIFTPMVPHLTGKYPIHHVNLLWSSGAIKTTETKDYSEPIKDKVGNLIPQGVFPKSNLVNINI